MPSDKHPFDVVAEKLEAIADKPVAAQDASPGYWELHSSTDPAVVGDYPQTEPGDEEALFQLGESEGLDPDGFLTVPVPEQRLLPTALWTDVLKAGLPASWSAGHLFNERALSVFRQSELGRFREYPAVVRDQSGSPRTLTYLHIRNIIEPVAIDFGQSEFYLADMVGTPKGPVSVTSFDDWQQKVRKAREGRLDGCEEFSRLDYRKLFFRAGQAPTVDYFTLARLGAKVYVSARLKDAIVSSGITGLEIKPNKRLFAGR